MNISIQAEDPASPEASTLIEELEALLEGLYPLQSRHGLSVEQLCQEQVEFHLLRCDGQPAGCGGLLWREDYAELKRMFVRSQFRGRGLAERLLEHLEVRACQRGLTRVRLETGVHQLAAIRLYEKNGYQRIPAFGPYRVDPLSLCYQKVIAGQVQSQAHAD